MNCEELINYLESQALNSSKGKLVFISKAYERKNSKQMDKLRHLSSLYVVGKSKRFIFHEKTVYEELLEILGDRNKVLEYAEKRELSFSRIYRPLSSLSGEKWRASIAIGLLSGKKIFLISDMALDIFNMYWSKWMKDLFTECIDAGITLVLIAEPDLYKYIKFDIMI